MPERVRRIHAFQGFGEMLRGRLTETLPGRRFEVLADEAAFVERVDEIEVLVAVRPPRGHWARAGRLRFLQLMGAGVDSVLPAPDLPESVRIANARGVHEPEMSEFALALMLALAKRLPRAFDQQRRREWKLFGTHGLSGRTAGVLGLGAIGRGVAERCRALGMRVVGTRRGGEALEGVDAVYGPEHTRRVLAESDVVVVVLPLTPETRGLLDAEALAAMKPGSFLVDVARGGIVDEAALAAALAGGRLAGAALDVFEEEPLAADSPLWSAPNLIVTPHVAGLSRSYLDRLVEIFAENVGRLERGEPLRNEVDRLRGY